VELPKFVVASETQYLFPNEVKRIGREVEIALQFKEIVARTEKFFGQDIFSPEEERTLQLLIDSRNQLRAKIQQAQTEADRRPIAHALNEANRRVRDILEAGSLQAIRARASSNEAALTRWKFREFPFFMFEE
jgi:23S rRNA G2069 N7-methylase RlmK/C1962 C5-methylase RlmI